jgi:hypothetical protein
MDTASEQRQLSKREFWYRIAGVSFALWSILLSLVAWIIGNATFSFIEEQKRQGNVFQEYVKNMEHRVTIIEERQNIVLQNLQFNREVNEKQNERLNNLEVNRNGKH